jgi:hypothetical protein
MEQILALREAYTNNSLNQNDHNTDNFDLKMNFFPNICTHTHKKV